MFKIFFLIVVVLQNYINLFVCLQLNHDHNNMVDGNGKSPAVCNVKKSKKSKKNDRKADLDNLKKEVEMVCRPIYCFNSNTYSCFCVCVKVNMESI